MATGFSKSGATLATAPPTTTTATATLSQMYTGHRRTRTNTNSSLVVPRSATAQASAVPTSQPTRHNTHPISPSSSPSASPPHTAILHTHRQNHNSSKLPAFRFADLSGKSPVVTLPSLLQNIQAPPSPVSPKDTPAAPVAGTPSSLQVQVQTPKSSSTTAVVDPPDNTTTQCTVAVGPAGDPRPIAPHHAKTDEPLPRAPVPTPPPADPASELTPARPSVPRAGLVHTEPPAESSAVSGPTADPPVSRTAPTGPIAAHAPAPVAPTPTANQNSSVSSLADKPSPSNNTTTTTKFISTGSNFVSRRTSTTAPPRTIDQTTATQQKPLPRIRASTYQPSAPASPTPSVVVSSPRRPSSFPTTTRNSSRSSLAAQPSTSSRRASRPPASNSANGVETSSGPPLSLSSNRLQTLHAAAKEQSGQRELILPKRLQRAPDEKQGSSGHRPPPLSFRSLSINGIPASPPVRVPPIRSFRSSGSRRSLVLGMDSRSPRQYDSTSDDAQDSDHRDRTLRALEGHDDGAFMRSESGEPTDPDDHGDVFLKIAGEESARRAAATGGPVDERGALTRVVRVHRRPLSSVVPSYQPSSPPRLSRRLSDQQDTSHRRRFDEDRALDQGYPLPYRGLVREKAVSVHPGEDLSRRVASASTRNLPATPRPLATQDPTSSTADFATYSRRRPSISESAPGSGPRTAPYKQFNLSYGPRSSVYNSSPLVPRSSADTHLQIQDTAPLEGTESTASTTGPSTVWDELDDLKYRIHRLELTGKLPATSLAAMSRASDDRPVTANTAATTMSTSPKRASAGGAPTADASSTTSSTQNDIPYPVLQAALAKTKLVLSAEAYQALESTVSESLALASMMGTVGQPGPISSGASTIGGAGSITDRQLRRKADSMCRSLTELCLALNDDSSSKPKTAPAQPPSQPTGAPQKDGPTTPTAAKSFAALAVQRRPAAMAEPQQTLARANTSPRAMTKLEERRNTLLSASALPSPRLALAPNSPLTPTDGANGGGRRSSLLIARRRAGTEEPEDQGAGRRTSLMLRTRRAGTEEPDEGRKTSLLRPRRGTVGEEDEEARLRAPSRANTDVNTSRGVSRDYGSLVTSPDSSSLTSSALPRRRLPSALNTRLTTPTTPTALATRRFFDRAVPERDGNSLSDRLAEDRNIRTLSLGQTAVLNRTTSLSRRPNRDSTPSGIASPAQPGQQYR